MGGDFGGRCFQYLTAWCSHHAIIWLALFLCCIFFPKLVIIRFFLFLIMAVFHLDDVTKFIANHPGGSEKILTAAGSVRLRQS